MSAITLPSLSQKTISHSKVSLRDESLKNYFNAFPKEKELKSLLPNIFVINKPMSGVGGDGYWAHPINDHQLFLIGYDCTGHGRIASIMTRIYLNAIKQSINSDENASTASILNEIHNRIKEQFQMNDTKMAGTAADMAVLKIDTKARKIQYSGAQMDLVKVQGGELEKIKADRRQVGDKFDIERDYKCVDINISDDKKDRFYIYSDGITDLFGGPNDKKFKFGNLKVLLNDVHNIQFGNSRNFIEQRLMEWSGPNPPLDDQLMIGLQL